MTVKLTSRWLDSVPCIDLAVRKLLLTDFSERPKYGFKFKNL